MKPRVLAGTGVLLLVLAALPLPAVARLRSSLYSLMKDPIHLTGAAARTAADLFHFRKNAADARVLKEAFGRVGAERFEAEELRLENARLRELLSLKESISGTVQRSLAARVIARSPLSWNRVLLIDKGAADGVRPHMPILAGHALAGKVVEVGPSAAKVLLLTDPNARIAVIIQRTRHQGVLYGSGSECRIKYLSVDADVRRGDLVETAGFGDFFPKGLRVGQVERVWKEPGQIYRVAGVRPLADLDRIEEVLCVE